MNVRTAQGEKKMKQLLSALTFSLISIQCLAMGGARPQDLETFAGNYECLSGCHFDFQKHMSVKFDPPSHSVLLNWIFQDHEYPAFAGGGFMKIDLGPQLEVDSPQYKTYFKSSSSKTSAKMVLNNKTIVCTPHNVCEPKWRWLEQAELTEDGMLRFTGYGAVYRRTN
jgi:hypothetical protein